MKILRFLSIVVLLAVLGGAFGATVGGLFGYALPRQVRFETRVEADRTGAGPGGEAQESSTGRSLEVGVGPEAAASPVSKGASLGAALGLTLGALLGLLLGILDQTLLRAVEWYGRRKEASE